MSSEGTSKIIVVFIESESESEIYYHLSSVGIPQVIVMESHTAYPGITLLFTTCTPAGWSKESERAFWIVLMICLYFIPLVMMAAAYSMIAKCLWKNVIPGVVESG